MTLLLFVLLLAQEPQEETGEKVSALQNRMGRINENLVRLENKLSELRGSSRTLADEVGELELERALLNGRIGKFELQVAEADERLAINETNQTSLMAQAAAQQKRIGDRLRKLYKRGTLGHSQMLLKQDRLSELINAYHYAKILTKRDHKALEDYRKTLQQLDIIAKRLMTIKAEAVESRANLAAEEDELKSLLRKRNQRLKQIKSEERKQRQLLKDLELEKEELRLMVLRLTEAEGDPMELRVPVSRYKGRLNWPHLGKIKRRFGVFREKEFKTKQRRNGIDISAPKGSEVRTMYSGKVLYADWFKSYGNLVIIDHGEKIITFYAHCERLLVEKGDFVERDAVIAISGDTGSLDGPMLHFEVRNKTVPENPTIWLKKRR